MATGGTSKLGSHRMRAIRLAVLWGIFVSAAPAAHSMTPVSIPVEFSADFVCNSQPDELIIESFLAGQGFAVGNLARVSRQSGSGGLPMWIEAYRDKRLASFWGEDFLPNHAILYHTTLDGPVPTTHDPKLEEAFRKFISEKLKCTVLRLKLSDKPTFAADMHERDLLVVVESVHHAVVCDRTRNTYDKDECRNSVSGFP